MAWREPDPGYRSLVRGVLAAAAICGYWLAFGLFRAIQAGSGELSLFELCTRVLLDSALAGFSTVAAVAALRGTQDRPTSVSRRLTSGRGTSPFALGVAAVALYGLASRVGGTQLRAGPDAPVIGWAIFAGLVALGVLAASGAVGQVWTRARAGRARLILASDPSYPGVPLAVVLEVPFALPHAPELDGALCLVGPGSAGWSHAFRIRAGDWEPAGPRASRVVLRVDAPFEGLAAGAPRAAIRTTRAGVASRHLCSLVATSRDDERWSTHLELPIEIVRPLAA